MSQRTASNGCASSCRIASSAVPAAVTGPLRRRDDEHHVARVDVVLDEQDPRAIEADAVVGPRAVGRRARWPRFGEPRQRGRERRALPFAGRMRGHDAPVHLDKLPRDREPHAEAAGTPGGAAVGLTEALEDVRKTEAMLQLASARGSRCSRCRGERHVDGRRPA
jgi:hypothetical protein